MQITSIASTMSCFEVSLTKIQQFLLVRKKQKKIDLKSILGKIKFVGHGYIILYRQRQGMRSLDRYREESRQFARYAGIDIP
eukprot:UN04428